MSLDTDTTCPKRVVGLVYDERMTLHDQLGHPECPERIVNIFNALKKEGLAQKCVRVDSREVKDEEVLLVHDKAWLDKMKEYQRLGLEADGETMLFKESRAYDSVYMNKYSIDAALLAAGSTVELTKQVCEGKLDSGLAVVRPPGHHAEAHTAMGFCFLNNAALAAKVAVEQCGLQRVAIIDWDVHHGNGTQNMFLDSEQVLYFSAHRYDKGQFYPGTKDGGPHVVGNNEGKGLNVNIGWEGAAVGDAHYKLAWQHVLLPILHDFNPQLIIVSAGFDAARGDPLGRCDLTPAGYASLLHMLTQFANGKVVVVLEGGYNVAAISASYAACARVLLHDFEATALSLSHERQSSMSPLLPHPVSVISPSSSSSPYSSTSSLSSSSLSSFSSSSTSGLVSSFSTSSSSPVTIPNSPPAAGSAEKLVDAVTMRSLTAILQTLRYHSQYWPSLLPYRVLFQMLDDNARAQSGVVQPTDTLTRAFGSLGLITEEDETEGKAADTVPENDDEKNAEGKFGEVDKQGSDRQGFAVEALRFCPHVTHENVVLKKPATFRQGREALMTMSCEANCGCTGENWLCLYCHFLGCSRYQNNDMHAHFKETGHCVVAGLNDLSFWCYKCESYLDHQHMHRIFLFYSWLCETMYGETPASEMFLGQHPG